jgi:hypothetical protein
MPNQTPKRHGQLKGVGRAHRVEVAGDALKRDPLGSLSLTKEKQHVGEFDR